VEIKKHHPPLWKEEKIINIEATTQKIELILPFYFLSSMELLKPSSEDYQGDLE